MLRRDICELCKKVEYERTLIPLAKDDKDKEILTRAVRELKLDKEWFCPAKVTPNSTVEQRVTVESEIPDNCIYRLEQILIEDANKKSMNALSVERPE